MVVRNVGSAGISSKGLDPEAAAELAALEEQLRKGAVAGIGEEPPQVQLPKKVDRSGAAGVMGQSAPRVAAVAQPVPASPDEAELVSKLHKLGYLPEGKVSRPALEQATQKFIKEHKGEAGKDGIGDVDDLFALLDKVMAEDNAKHPPSAWSGQSRAQRNGMLPSQSTYANQGPAPNTAALQQQAAQAIATAHPPPPAGSINAKIADACKKYMGTSTAAGPDGGNLACAWSVNNILSNAGLQKVGSNPNYVPSVEGALQGGRGTAVDMKDAKPGDIVIFPGAHHIGIYMGNGMVANNSSSHAAFVNMTGAQAGMHVYRVNS
jgi:cell wall-associated NlpC family hydrolase